jgi:hypothetical protein
MSDSHDCCHRTFKQYHYWPCQRAAKIERGGKWYCATHDPVKVAERNSKRNAKWEACWKQERDDREAAEVRKVRISKLIQDAAGHVATREELRELASSLLPVKP